jgi:hypothetical protein
MTYGLLTLMDGRVRMKAHIAFYERFKGPIPDGLDLDHLCRVPRCVRPEHLEAVTTAVNCQRGTTTKLTADDVREIRRLYGTMRRIDIAERFGVKSLTIWEVAKRKTWQNIE